MYVCAPYVSSTTKVLAPTNLPVKYQRKIKLKQEKQDAMVVDMNHSTTIFYRNRNAAEIQNQVRSYPRQAKENSSTDISNRTESKMDYRKTNIGCAMLQNCYSWQNVDFFDEALQALNEVLVATTTNY